MNGAREYACMLKFAPVSLAAWRIVPKTPLVLVMWVVALINFLLPILRLEIIWMVSGLFGVVRIIYGHVRRPPIGGSASSNITSGGYSPSTTAPATESADSLYSMSVCDFTFPMCDWRCFVSLAQSSWSVRCKRSLCR